MSSDNNIKQNRKTVLPALSMRLRTIAEMVSPGKTMADVGTDHALVPVFLVLRGTCPFAYAMDIGSGPLARAKESIDAYGLTDRIMPVLSDGLEKLSPGLAESIVIAGMGGELVCRILSSSMETAVRAAELILSPHSEAFKVRCFLREAGWLIDHEKMVEEEGKYYPVIHAIRPDASAEDEHDRSSDNVSNNPDDALNDLYGPVLLRTGDPVLLDYLKKERAVKERILLKISENAKACSKEAGQNPGTEERLREIRRELAVNKRAMDLMNKKQYREDQKMNQENEVLLIWEGKEYRFPQGTVYRDVANSLLFDEDVLLVLENNHLRELHHRAKSGSEIKLLTYADKAGAKAYQRSLFLLLCAAVNKLHGCDPDYLISVHFVAGNGLYCTLQDSSKVTSEFLKEAESVMRSLVDAAVPIRKYLVPTDEAVKVFRTNNMRDKERLFKYRRNSRTNLYELDGYRDYYYGYMVDNTRLLSSFSLDQYDTGFILHYPQSRFTHLNGYALPDSKLFDVQKSSEEWCEKIRMRNIGDLNDCIVSGEITSVIRSQEAFQEMKISKIASLIAADKRKKIIMIAGPSSSGKTSFSHRLTTQLTVHGLTPHPIPVDDYFLDREKTPRHPDGTYNFECLEAIDIHQFNEDMTGLLQGKEVELPTFNFKTGKREYKGSCLKLQPDDVLVIEGIHCLNDQLSFSLPHENKFKIYISALTQLRVDEHNRIPTTDGRLLRRLVRDARTRGTKAEGTIGMWPSVRAGEENYIFPYQESADVMFNSALAYELAVLKIFAEPLLFGIPRDDPAHVEAKRLLKFLDYVLPISPEQIPADSLIREFIGGSCFPV